jgi:plastocyanin
MRKLIGGLALAVMACGGAERAEDDAPTTEAREEAPTTGTVHEVRMLLTEAGAYVYDPVELTIKTGDTVRWLNISGPPHNVAFYADRIPDGAKDVLNAAMPNRMGDLSGPLMMQINEVYTISFANAPSGVYEYFCTPHEMLGMTARLTITE